MSALPRIAAVSIAPTQDGGWSYFISFLNEAYRGTARSRGALRSAVAQELRALNPDEVQYLGARP
jgi:hypothetical protein